LEAARNIYIAESDALHGIGIDPIVKKIIASPDVKYPLFLRGNPPVGTCTICVGKKEIGWKQHFGVVRPLENQLFYRGE
ncbi:MAG: cobalamin biosynthesis protein, partial [Pseudomonadota bacterium]